MWIYAMVAVLAITVGALAGCTRVGDRLTGVEITTGGPTSCVKNCNDKFIRDLAAETKRSLQNLFACSQLPTHSERTACYSAELSRYAAAVSALWTARNNCVNSCHKQGAGSAG
jgi:hypothetical protein